MKKFNLSKSIFKRFSFERAIPEHYRANFFHLYMDMAWFGVLNGSVLAFLSIYAARIGASAAQIGFLTASPAVMNLLFALPSGNWIQKQPIRKSVYISAIAARFFYLILIPLPFLFSNQNQIWMIILVTMLINIPGTALAVGANALFAEAVPDEYRGHVAGLRNAVLSITTASVTILSGWILTIEKFPIGYQIVFAIGVVGAAFSCLHLYFVKPQQLNPPGLEPIKRGKSAQFKIISRWRRWEPDFRKILTKNRLIDGLALMKGPFGTTIVLLFLFHLGQYLAIPVFPLFQVNSLHLTDHVISLGSGIFSISMFVGSTQLEKFISRFGNHKVFAVGVMLLGAYPLLVSLGSVLALYYLAGIVGGYAWALAGGALYNYLLEKIPSNDRPKHLAWYNLWLNAAILIGAMAGPAVGVAFGLQTALWIFAACRFLAGVAILRWG
jgi:MFS family permease